MGALRERLFPSAEAEVRLLLLISAFGAVGMRGRTQLAKTDFFLRYPRYLNKALKIRGVIESVRVGDFDIESRMIRHRYGPWDPAYFGLLGRLRSRKLIEWVATGRGVGFRATGAGERLARSLGDLAEWRDVNSRALLISRHLNMSGDSLRRFIYQHFPEVVARRWGAEITDAA